MKLILTLLACVIFTSILEAQSPGGVSSSLNLWLKADSGPEKAGAVPAGNGEAIVTWKDRSGLGRDYTAVAGPTLQTSILNFNPAVQILSGGFDAPVAAALGTDWTVFFVSRKLASDNDGRLFEGNAGNFLWTTWGTYTNSIYLNGSPPDYNAGIATLTGIQNLHLHTYKRESTGGTLEARADGTSLTTFGTSNSASGIQIDIDAGAFAAEASDAHVGEMIIYSTPLTASEVTRVESYLAIKYGLTKANNYTASNNTIIWNSATNAGYLNDVTGIGRDDNSGLNQLKSTSINAGSSTTLEKVGAFGSDNTFILWGHDAATGVNANISSAYVLRSKRIWKAAVSGTPGVVTLTVDLSALSLPNTGTPSDYVLLKDTDNDFSVGATADPIVPTLAGSLLTFTGASLADGNTFAIAISNLALPGSVPGLSLWLKADSGPEKVGNVPAVAGDAIITWKDKSGLGNDYAAVAGPTLSTSTINNNPVVEILSGGFDAPAAAALGLDWTVFFVSKKLASDDDGRVFDGNAGNFLWAHWGPYTNSLYLNGNPSNYNSGIATTSGIRNLHLHSYRRESAGGTLEARADGTSLTTFGASNSASGVRIDIEQGASAAESSDVQIGEMMIFSTPLSAAEIVKVESYLGIKYGMTLAHDFVASDGVTLWNATTNATYHHDVAGIGRDNSSLLNQLKSLSINPGAGIGMEKVGAFGSNKDFLLWGNDAATGTSNNIPATYTMRTNRVWKAAVNGAPGAVTMTVDLAALSFPNTGVPANYFLLKDTDNDFSAGATADPVVPTLAGNVLTFTGVSFSDGEFFAIAAANVPLPGGIAGLTFWVKGGVGVTGTTNVSKWADQSGQGNDANQLTPANQPALVTNDLNFNDDINFYQPTSIMTLTTPPANQNTTIFAVAIPKANNDWRTMFRGVANDHPIIVETGGTRLGYYDADNIGFVPSGFTWLQNEPAIVSLEMRTGNTNFRKNGTQGAAIATINLAGQALDFFGAYQGGSQNFGKIAEAIIFTSPSALTTPQKVKVESYLGVKYGITISHDYVASDGAIVWSATANATYHNNIAGIGRDDNSLLSQLKSLSVNTGAGIAMQKVGAFGSDKDFLLWGSDLSTGTSNNISATYTMRTNRVWKAAVHGTPGTVTMTVDLNALSFPNTGVPANYVLLKDTDNDFSAGATADPVVPTLAGNTLTFTGVSFTDGDFFAIAASNVPLPGGISGLVFWVKGGVGVTGTTNVSKWADQSGLGNDANQLTPANQPALVASDLNFNDAVNFYQNTSIMTLTTPPGNLNTTIFAVAKPNANTDYRTLYRSTAGDHPILVEVGGTRLGYFDADNGGFKPSGFTWLQNEPAVVSLEMRAGDTNFRKNGTQGASNATINLGGMALDYLGAYQGGSQNFGRIAETIVFTTPAPLTATQKIQIESYLGIKYGITIAHDYLASDGVTLWNATTNAAYQNHVAGIGRDDNSSLNQLKSLSVNAGAGLTIERVGSFGSNNDFLVWGRNTSTGTSTNVSSSYSLRTGSIWKAAVRGTPGAVSVTFDLSTIGFPNTGSASDYVLLKDTDTDFSAGYTADPSVPTLVGTVLTFPAASLSDGDLFVVAASNIVLPGGIPGLTLWLKADSGPEKAAGVPAANGDAITTWKDKSGLGHDYVAVAGPALVTSAINNNPAVQILSGGFNAPVGAELASDWSVFFISRKLASDDDGRLFDSDIGNFLWAHWGTYTNSIYLNGSPSNYNSGIATTTGIRNLHLHSYRRESAGGTLEARADGTVLTTFGSSNSASGIKIDIDQGANAGESSDAQVGEMIIYNGTLTNTEVNKIESYLAIKYGLTVAHDYVASTGAVIWNATTNATYHRDVAGIARDDNSLNQLKSLSINVGAALGMEKVGAFASDKTFLIWGNDGATGTSSNVPATLTIRTRRVWKAAVMGTPGAVTMTVDLNALGFPNTGNPADYTLLKDTDNDFSAGATSDPTVPTLAGGVLTFTGVTFSNNDTFTLGAINIPVPGGVTGMVFWVKADAGVVGTTNVSKWTDQSGSNNDANQLTVANQPSLVTNDINFNSDIDFYQPVSIMTLATPPANLNSTIFTVAKPRINTDWRTMFRGASSDHPLLVETGTTRLGYYDNDGVGFNWSGFTWTQDEVAVVGVEMRTGNVNFRKNGIPGGPIAGINLAGLALDYFGAYQGGSQNFGRIAETIVYNTAAVLTPTEKQRIESYLGIKYGVTLANNYLASDGTTLWNVTTNATYTNRVTGIGKDVTNGLDQRKSLSVHAGAVVTIDKGGAFGTDKSFLLWGDNNAAMAAASVTDYPSAAGLIGRIARAWKLSQTGPVGAVAIRFNLSSIPGPKNAVDLRLLVDRDKNGFFGNETVGGGGVIGGAVDLGGDVFEFPGVSFNDGELVTIGTVSASTPLPITLVSFNAAVDGQLIRVNWTTSTEVNNDFFTLQRSKNGFEFEQLTKVQGAGTSTSTHKYSFADAAPNEGVNYYRLKQTDFNGTSSLSGIIAVRFEKPTELQWNVYPNPARSEFIIDAPDVENSELMLTNSLGQRVQLVARMQDGKITVDTAHLPRGLYFVTIKQDGKTSSRKIVLD